MFSSIFLFFSNRSIPWPGSKAALRVYSAVQMRSVSRTSPITAKFANFGQQIANLLLRWKSDEILAHLWFWCRRIFRKLGEESKLKVVVSGVPDGAARQNTRSSGRIWASWKKKTLAWAGWEIWMSALLAENMKNLCRFWLDKKVYFFSWQSHCNFLYGY